MSDLHPWSLRRVKSLRNEPFMTIQPLPVYEADADPEHRDALTLEEQYAKLKPIKKNNYVDKATYRAQKKAERAAELAEKEGEREEETG